MARTKRLTLDEPAIRKQFEEKRRRNRILLARFDAFNVDHGGHAVAFDGRFGRYALCVRDYGKGNWRGMEVIFKGSSENFQGDQSQHQKTYDDPKIGLIAGFLDDIDTFGGDIGCGSFSWGGAMDYPGFRRELKSRMGATDNLTKAAESYLRDIEKSDLAQYMCFAIVLRHAEQKNPDDPEEALRNMVIGDNPNFKLDGDVMLKIDEFLAVLASDETRRRMSVIANEPTQEAVSGGKAFSQTGMGLRLARAGWDVVSERDDLGRLRPLLKRDPGHILGDGWVDLPERLKSLPTID